MISDIDITELKINVQWHEIEGLEDGFILEMVGVYTLPLFLQQLILLL